MKKFLPLAFIIILLIVVDAYAVKGIGAEYTAPYLREFLYQSFSGSLTDWIGLVVFNVILLGIGIAQALEIDVYEGKGYGKIIAIGLALVASICLIYAF
jgi:hypothetical protein